MMKKFVVLSLALVLMGCGRGEETPAIFSREVVKFSSEPVMDAVWLEDVEPPVWNENFAVLEGEGDSFVVDWGSSTGNFVMAESSGFPGFGKPVLIVGECCPASGCYSLQTSYGKWTYTTTVTKEAVLNDKKDNLIDKLTGDKLIDFAISDEVLYIWDSESRIVTIAYLSSGTQVAVREASNG